MPVLGSWRVPFHSFFLLFQQICKLALKWMKESQHLLEAREKEEWKDVRNRCAGVIVGPIALLFLDKGPHNLPAQLTFSFLSKERKMRWTDRGPLLKKEKDIGPTDGLIKSHLLFLLWKKKTNKLVFSLITFGPKADAFTNNGPKEENTIRSAERVCLCPSCCLRSLIESFCWQGP